MNYRAENIKLEIVFRWTCLSCQGVNYTQGDPVDVEDEDVQDAIRQELDLEDWQPLPDDIQEDDFHMQPAHLDCEHCGAHFSTDEPQEEESDDDFAF